MAELEGLLTCRICGETLPPIPNMGRLIGSDVANLSRDELKIAGQFQAVATHLQRKHPRRDRFLEATAAGFLGILRIMEYRTTDKGIMDAREFGRWTVAQTLLQIGPRISDQHIETKSREFADHLIEIFENDLEACGAIQDPLHPSARAMLQLKTAGLVNELVTTIRNALEERDKYPARPSVAMN